VVLVGPLALLLLFGAGNRRPLATLLLLPGLLAWVIPSAYNYSRFGAFETSHAGGFALSGHVAWAIHPVPGAAYSAEAALVEAAVAPALARRPAKFASVLEYVDYTANEYNGLLWGLMVPRLDHYYAGLRPDEPCTWDARQRDCVARHVMSINRALLQLSRQAIAAQPGRYFRHVAAHDYGLWRDAFAPGNDILLGANYLAEALPTAYDPARNAYLALLGPLPPFKGGIERWSVISRVLKSPSKRLFDLVTLREGAEDFVAKVGHRYPMAIFVISLLGCLLVLRFPRLSPGSKAFCYCALCINAYFLGTALAQPSLVRYAAGMQGLLAAMLALGGHALWSAVRARIARWFELPDEPYVTPAPP
jgi:hypothetical protein